MVATPDGDNLEDVLEEKENPYFDWPTFTNPWEFLLQQKKCQLWKQDIYRYGRREVGPMEDHPDRTTLALWEDYREIPLDELLSCFFTKGRPIWSRLGQSVDRWLVWAVTQGRYRMDAVKNLYAFKGRDHSILHLANSKGFWDTVHPAWENFPILRDITAACNSLCDELLRRVQRCGSTTAMCKNTRENLINLPELVMFQSYRTHDHKHFRWHYQPGATQGAVTPDAAKPMRLPKHSVHHILKEYHAWLPAIKDKSK